MLTPFPGYVGPAGLLLTSPSPNVARMAGRPQTAMPQSAGRSLHPQGRPELCIILRFGCLATSVAMVSDEVQGILVSNKLCHQVWGRLGCIIL